MQLNIVTGFLGSGKTTAICHAARLLIADKKNTGVITNDQGTRLVDGNLFAALGIPGRQVPGGCFCCNYNELDKHIQSLQQTESLSLLFAEAVGSCTDIIATVVNPLRQYHPEMTVTVSTFTDIRLLNMMLEGNHSFDESVAYIYFKQLEEAAIIIVNKTDLVNEDFLHAVRQKLSERYGGKTILYQDSMQEKDIREWLGLLNELPGVAPFSSLEDINYDVYAAGEAKMTWYDQHLEIFAENNNAGQIAENLVNSIYTGISKKEIPIGHIKFLIDDTTKISFTETDHNLVELSRQDGSSVTVLINIRVQAPPDEIEKSVKKIITGLDHSCRIIASPVDVFSPGYPKPLYRIQ